MKKETTKILGLFVLGIIALSFVVSAVDFWDTFSAGIKEGVSGSVKSVTNFANTDKEAFVKVLFFILVLLIVVSITSFIPLFENKKGISFLFSVVVSILAVFYIPADLVNYMLNPYSAIGIAFLTIIPFVLMFVFVDKMLKNNFLKQLAWFVFAVALLGLTVYVAVNPDERTSSFLGASTLGWIYGICSLIALGMCFWGGLIESAIWRGKLTAQEQSALKGIARREMNRRVAGRADAAAAGALAEEGRASDRPIGGLGI